MRPANASYRDFTGGQNDRFSSMTIDPKEAVKVQNFFGDEINGLSVQPFASKVGALPSGTGWNGLWVYERLTTNLKSLVAANVHGASSGYFTSDDGKTWTPATDAVGNNLTYDSGNIPEAVSFQGKLWLTNGNDPVLNYDGVDWLPVGAARVEPDAVPGVLTGVYKYQVTFTLDGVEYIRQVDSFSLTLSSKKVNLTKIPLGPPDSTSRNIYRTKAGGSIYYLLPPVSGTVLIPPNIGTNYNTLPDNSTTSYQDNTPDSSLVTQLADPPGNADHIFCPIPKAFYPVIHQNRLWMIKTVGAPNGAYFSEVNEPDYFPPDSNGGSIIEVPTEGDILWGAVPFNGNLIFLTERALWTLCGNNVFTQFELDKILSSIGSLFHRSLKIIYLQGQQLLILLSKLGFYLFDGTTNPLWISKNISNTFGNLQQPTITFGDAIFDDITTFGNGTYDPTVNFDTTLEGVALKKDTVGSETNKSFNFTGGTFQGAATGPGNQVLSFSDGILGSLPDQYIYESIVPSVGGFNMTITFDPVIAERIEYGHQEIPNVAGTANLLSYNVSPLDVNGNKITTVSIVPSATPVTEEISFTSRKVYGIYIETQAQENGYNSPLSPFSYIWSIPSLYYQADVYPSSGTWLGPVVDTATSDFKQWKNLLTEEIFNGQQIIYSIRSGPDGHPTPDSSWTAWTNIVNGSQITELPTNRYVQVRITLSQVPLGNQTLSGMSVYQKYDGDILPQSNLYAPFTQGGVGMVSTIIDMGNTSLRAGSGGASTLEWTRDSSNWGWVNLDPNGWSMEMSFRLAQCPVNTVAFTMQAGDGVLGAGLGFWSNKISGINDMASLGSYTVNLIDGKYHKARITAAKLSPTTSQVDVYLDGTVILSGIVTTSSASNNIKFGRLSASVVCDYYVDYLYWINSVVTITMEDPTSTPVVQSLFFSWLSSSTSLFPTNNVCSEFFLNRYWFSGLEFNSKGITTNNVFYILDTNGRWFFRRGSLTPAKAAVMVTYKEKLWWGASDSLNLYQLNDMAIDKNIDPDGTLATIDDCADYIMKKDDFNVARREKLFRTLYIKYKSSEPFSIIAYVDDDKITSFTVPASEDENTVVLNFKPDGTQIGTHLQLEILNAKVLVQNSVINAAYTSTLAAIEIYSIEVLMKVFEPRMSGQMGTTV